MDFVFYDSLFPLTEANSKRKFYWDKKLNDIHWNSFDLKDFYLSYGIHNTLELAKFLNLEKDLINEYELLLSIISKIPKTYKNSNIPLKNINYLNLIPSSILKSVQSLKLEILKKAKEFIDNQKNSEEIYNFFIKSNVNVLKKMNYKIKTSEGVVPIDLLYALNFRFKAAADTLNLFHMPTEQRKIIIPQNEKSIIFACDFRQFEFRTYLMLLLKHIDVDFENLKLYDHFAEKIGLQSALGKNQIIAYLYGSQNDKIEKVLSKEPILNQIKNNPQFKWRDYLVILNPETEEHKKFHSVIQTISQHICLNKLCAILRLFEGKVSTFLYPFHDELIFSLEGSEMDLMKDIKLILEDDIYKIKCFAGKNLFEMKEIEI